MQGAQRRQGSGADCQEFEILQYLAENKGRVISRERLYEAVWNEDSFGCDNTVMVHIRHLREKMENDPTAPMFLLLSIILLAADLYKQFFFLDNL